MIEYSGDIRVDALISYSGTANWNSTVGARPLYYTFDLAGVPTLGSGMTAFNAAQQAAAIAILAHAGSVTGISFVQVATNAEADIHFAATNVPGHMGYETSFSTDAYVYLDNAEYASATASPTPGGSGYEVLLHEVGHVLGLGHPFDGPYYLDAAHDNNLYTVMSYLAIGSYKSTFQEYDLLALRWIYGGDGIRGNWGFNSVNGPSLTLVVDHDAPTALSFNPTDDASGVAVEANIVVTFNEPIVRGSGTVVLKTAAGTVIESFDAATSANLSFSDATLTVNPAFDLSRGTSYKLEIASGAILDQAHNAYTGTTSYNFSTIAPDVPVVDTTGPSVALFSPADEATGVAVGANITVLFSEAIVRGVGAIVLKTASGTVVESFDVSSNRLAVSGVSLTIDPTTDLAINTGYKIEFAAGNFRDNAGNASAPWSAYNFTTIAPDVTAPIVTTFNPVRSETQVPTNANIVVGFNEAIARGDGMIMLKSAQGAVVETFDAAASTNLNISGTELTINPTFDLARNGTYSLEINPGAIRDLSGNSYVGSLNYSFSTVTGPAPDTTGPTVVSFNPADESSGVAVDANIVVTFDEAIQRGSGPIQIKIPGFGLLGTYDAVNTPYISISGNQLTFNPPSDLLMDMTYQVTFAQGTIKDMAGNSYLGTSSYNFSTAVATNTDTSPPTVSTFSPADEARGVATTSDLILIFNEAIVRGTGSAVLRDTAGAVVESYDMATSSRVSISGSQLTINPSADLLNGVGYSLMLPSGSVKDVAGNAFSGTSGYNFSTFAAGQTITGTNGVDALAGGPGDDTIYGLDGNDSLTGGNGDDSLHGDGGRDTATYAGARSQYSVSTLYGLHTITGVTTNDGRDVLIDVERARFADSSVAFDTGLSEHAGETALLIGATLGANALTAKKELVGAVLALMDEGYSMQVLSGAVMRLPIWDLLAGGTSNTQIARYLLTTVLGKAPDAATLAAGVASLDHDPQGDMLWHLAQTEANQAQVNLVGLTQNGLEFV